MHSSNWDNLRYVLAVADMGTVSAAARALGVNHATVLRRVAAFEADHGGAVFERTATGYQVLPERARVIDAAREVENGILSVERLMHGTVAPLRGEVRVSSTDSICQVLLPPLVAQLHAESTELQINLLSTNTHADFARMQADISVRPALALPDEMTGDSRATLAFRAYHTPGASDCWLSLSGALARSIPAKWMETHIPADRIATGSDSFLVLRELAKLGLGTAILPVFVGETTPGLVRHPGAMPMLSVPIWVGTHSDLRDVPRIRIVRERILTYLAERAPTLDGTTGIRGID
ncbi:LysR family transcriptional regulator [Sedimentitalea todarodis]|uniref:LysR family transcriptional regulator n=1 Tax=Sedimentitalea todarodis TaxID=1631240 RepID=A0ABU3VAK2_9RHOB|nr:LysR family transcriptional regulator [Sedimentitalea todarodis]MDU9003198.1 LysR family transcriptional regulator [Sedimentitalea todarodis]